MAKSTPTNHNGGVSPYSAAQHLEAVEKAEALMDDGRSTNKAAAEVGAEYRVSRVTIQRWATNLGRPMGQYARNAGTAHTAAANAAKRQYTGADFRTTANNMMALTQAALAEVMEAAQKTSARSLLPDLSRIGLLFRGAIQVEQKLIELGFGHDPLGGDTGADDDEERPDNVIDWELRTREAERVRARMAGESE